MNSILKECRTFPSNRVANREPRKSSLKGNYNEVKTRVSFSEVKNDFFRQYLNRY